EPRMTQPVLYQKIDDHPTIANVFAKDLEEKGIVNEEEFTQMQQKTENHLKEIYESMKEDSDVAELKNMPEELRNGINRFDTTVLKDGTPIRMTGQDAERGTFAHRHAVWNDWDTNKKYVPLQELKDAGASFDIRNSPLSEAGVLGFEYGYSVHSPETLVIWE